MAKFTIEIEDSPEGAGHVFVQWHIDVPDLQDKLSKGQASYADLPPCAAIGLIAFNEAAKQLRMVTPLMDKPSDTATFIAGGDNPFKQ